MALCLSWHSVSLGTQSHLALSLSWHSVPLGTRSPWHSVPLGTRSPWHSVSLALSLLALSLLALGLLGTRSLGTRSQHRVKNIVFHGSETALIEKGIWIFYAFFWEGPVQLFYYILRFSFQKLNCQHCILFL